MTTRARKALESARANPNGLAFADLVALAKAAGYERKRTSGSHQVYARPNTPEIMTFQPAGAKAKPYQVRQLLDVIEKYDITIP